MNKKWICWFSVTGDNEEYSEHEVQVCSPAPDEAAILALARGQSHVDVDNDIWLRVE